MTLAENQYPNHLRENALRRVEGERYDLIILGGGVQGVFTARDAALRGLRVLLLERNDFAYGASSRSSKLLHGGVRYLEQWNLPLVREALLERGYLLKMAPHLARMQRFYFPVIPGLTRSGWQIRAGLALYDILSSAFRPAGSIRFPNSSPVPSEDSHRIELLGWGLKHRAAVQYFDAQMDDARIVIEAVIATSKTGAVTLNYCESSSAKLSAEGWAVRFRCRISDTEHTARGALLINAGGPSAPEIHTLTGKPWPGPTPTYSSGVHLVFNQEWTKPALILPTGERGRYYFVLPHYAPGVKQTLVGTTDRPVLKNQENPQPTEAEREELLLYLSRDLPGAGLVREKICGEFAGMRILGGGSSKTSEQSRSEALLRGDRYLCLFGGKWTTARAIAERAVDAAVEILGRTVAPCSTRTELLPDSIAKYQPLTGDDYLRARIKAAVEEEFACTVEDVVSRRLRMAFHPDRMRAEEIAREVVGVALGR